MTKKLLILFYLFPILVLAQTPADKVNPFIGTAKDGNTFPGAVLPWGMVSVSPHNGNSPSGYSFGKEAIKGFGHIHLSGTGCPDQGSVILMPTTGEIDQKSANFQSPYSNEKAEAGYYSVQLDKYKIKAEMTATLRSGLSRYIYPKEKGNFNILIDAGQSLSWRKGGSVSIVSADEVEGYNVTGGFCGSNNQHKVYFVAKLNKKAARKGTWLGQTVSDQPSVESSDSLLGAWFSFNGKPGDTLLVKVGISYVSIKNARENLNKEQTGFQFNKVKKQAKKEWNSVLSKIDIKGGTPDQQVQFYTGIYHMLIHPGIRSDVNGDYVKMNQSGTGNSKIPQYTVYSLWDTYRTVHPFLSLVFPKKQAEIVQSMITMAEESGWLPKWELAGNETQVMVGDPAAIVIADTWLKGIKSFDVEKAWKWLEKGATDTSMRNVVRPGLKSYIRNGGFIPMNDTTDWVWGPVSTSLEYNLADWHLAKLAESLGKKKEADLFLQRSEGWRKMVDSESGFIRPTLKDGSFAMPFNPDTLETAGGWPGSGGPGYVEGNAWHYSFFVPHNLSGLLDSYGKKQVFRSLNTNFRKGHFSLNNEPAMAFPFVYNYTTEPYKGIELSRDLMHANFKNSPDGLPGNDDCGTLSGWFVFSSMGFYPDCPGTGNYQISSPLWSEVTIKLDEPYQKGKTIKIKIKNNSDIATTVGRRFVNGKQVNDYFLNHQTLVKGALIEYEMYDRIVVRTLD
ncbi:MAG: GH92 family glycosyl hydrolase [Bacteroidetes bacterium]|nr:GH92 family glycosyl hydrolase [Bacteroidota bacterium]